MLCLIRAIKRYLSRMEQFRSECSGLLLLMSKRRNGCPKTPFCFGLGRQFPSLISQQGSQGQCSHSTEDRYFTFPQKELCSTVSTEGCYLVITDDLLSQLSKRCHPQVWIPSWISSPSALTWFLKRLCSLLALWLWCSNPRFGLLQRCVHHPLYLFWIYGSFIFTLSIIPEELQQPYTQESLVST